MRYFVLSILIPFWLSSVPGQAFGGGFKPQARIVKNSPEAEQEDQKNVTIKLLQQQVNLLSRIEKSLNSPDPNQIRAVRGQLTLQVHAVEHFLQVNYPDYQVLCTSSVTEVTSTAQAQYCSLSAYNQELLKLSPILDQLLARRGELALVRPLPLVSGERQLDSVLTIAPIQRPQLSQPAIPFNHEPDLPPTKIPIIGLNAKTPIANYVPPLQPAIIPPTAALTIIQTARNFLAQAESVFSPNQLLNSPTATSNNDTYALNPQFLHTYSQFLSLPNTGIVRILPDKIYHHSPNTLQNRLQPNQHPFARLLPLPNFAPQLALAIESEQFQLVSSGIDYGFMTDLGDMPLEKLNAGLTNIPQLTRTSFLNYRPPQQLEALQLDKRRFLLASLQNQLLPQVPAVLQHTYLMRTLQFQLPEIIVNSQPVSRQDRSHQGELLQTSSSDLILAFRPVYRHPDGSYTVLWRVLSQFRDPQIDDLVEYVKFE
jgi:hypothetical protein